jgi:hypothetical protein
VYVDAANDLVVVPWIPEGLAVVGRIVESLRSPAK